MGSRTLVAIVSMLAAGAGGAQEAPTKSESPAARNAPPPVVYLYGIDAMEKLKAANPDHYARAERILAAADELCKPGPEQVYYARFEASTISCEAMMLKTSLPPKRQIGFTLDNVRYIALVTVKDAQGQFRRIPGEELQMHPKDLRQPVPPVQPVEAGK
jgi:hypothetical protein